MKNSIKTFIFFFICVFSFMLIGCDEKKEKTTPQDIVDAFKENERQQHKKPSRIKDLPKMEIF